MEQLPNTARRGGWTEVARALSTPAQPVSRQQVYAWWMRRDRNGFPNGSCAIDENCAAGGRRVFDFAEVVDWYASYRPSVGGRPRKNAA